MPGEPEPTHWLAVAGEDADHFHTVTHLVDRVLESNIEWFAGETRDHMRRWRGPNEHARWWALKAAFREARAVRLPIYGHFDGVPKHPEAGMIRAQLLLWQRAHLAGRRISVGIVVRDTDGADRIAGAFQAIRDRAKWPFCIVLAYPNPEIEAWTIVAFEPETAEETRRLANLTQRLGFSPVAQPERLTSTTSTSQRDAKRVLAELTGGDPLRRAACLDRPLRALEERGASCGLSAFLEAVEREVIPLYTRRS